MLIIDTKFVKLSHNETYIFKPNCGTLIENPLAGKADWKMVWLLAPIWADKRIRQSDFNELGAYHVNEDPKFKTNKLSVINLWALASDYIFLF